MLAIQHFFYCYLLDILKETPKTHRDNELLSKAIASLKEVMTHINEDKRKIENQLAMFVLINDIENCPVRNSERLLLLKIMINKKIHSKTLIINQSLWHT